MGAIKTRGVVSELMRARLALAIIMTPEARAYDRQIEEALVQHDSLSARDKKAKAELPQVKAIARDSVKRLARLVDGLEVFLSISSPTVSKKLPDRAAYKDVDVSMYAEAMLGVLAKEGGLEERWVAKILRAALKHAVAGTANVGEAIQAREARRVAARTMSAELNGVLGHAKAYIHKTVPRDSPAHRHIQHTRTKPAAPTEVGAAG